VFLVGESEIHRKVRALQPPSPRLHHHCNSSCIGARGLAQMPTANSSRARSVWQDECSKESGYHTFSGPSDKVIAFPPLGRFLKIAWLSGVLRPVLVIDCCPHVRESVRVLCLCAVLHGAARRAVWAARGRGGARSGRRAVAGDAVRARSERLGPRRVRTMERGVQFYQLIIYNCGMCLV
jgi:hypothetical protein